MRCISDVGEFHEWWGRVGARGLLPGVVVWSILSMVMRTFASELVCSLGVSGLELTSSGIVELVPFPVSVSVSARLSAPFVLPDSRLSVASSGLSSVSFASLGRVK